MSILRPLLALCAALLCIGIASPALAQDTATTLADSTIIATPPASSDALQHYFTLALGIVTPLLMAGLERVAPIVRNWPAVVKQTIVAAIPFVVTMLVAWAKERYPWMPLDPTVASASISTAVAFAIHAGQTAKEAKVQVADRGD